MDNVDRPSLQRRRRFSSVEPSASETTSDADRRFASPPATVAADSVKNTNSLTTFWTALAGKRPPTEDSPSTVQRKKSRKRWQVDAPKVNLYWSSRLLAQIQEASQADRRRQLHQFVPGEWIRWARQMRVLREREQRWESWLRQGHGVTALTVSWGQREASASGAPDNAALAVQQLHLEPWDASLLAPEASQLSYETVLETKLPFDPNEDTFGRAFAVPSLVWLTSVSTSASLPALDLTLPAERRRLRHQRRLQRRQEVEGLIRSGAMPPPLAHRRAFSGVLAALEARHRRTGSAYSTLDAEGLRQVAAAMVTERMQQHEARNAAKKRSDMETMQKEAQKRARDRQRALVTTAYICYSDRSATAVINRMIHHFAAMMEPIGLNGMIVRRHEGASPVNQPACPLVFAVFAIVQGGPVASRKCDAFLQRRLTETKYNLTWQRIWRGPWTANLPMTITPCQLHDALMETTVRRLVGDAQVTELYDLARACYLRRVRVSAQTNELGSGRSKTGDCFVSIA